MNIASAARIRGLAVAAAASAFVIFVGCGGGTGGVPSGSTVGYLPSPAASATFAPTTVTVSIAVPAAGTQSKRIRPQYFSPSTQSMTIQLVSVNGSSVPTAPVATIDTYAGAPGCTSGSSGLTCTGTVTGSSGNDVFTVNAYAQPRGTGSVLSSGTFASNVAINATIQITNASSQTLSSQIASIAMTSVPAVVTVGTAATMKLVVTARDAGNAIIVGPGAYTSPIALSISGDTTNAFSFQSGGQTQSLTSPADAASLKYNGDPNASVGSVTIQASTQGASGMLTVNTPVQVSPSPTPKPTPTPIATPTPITTPTPTTSPSSQSEYVLNEGANGGIGATITVYHLGATGNIAPDRVLNLSGANAAFGLAVDAHGYVYVGYYDSGFQSSVDAGNEIDVYAPGASGNALPVRRILADTGASNTSLDPGFIAFDPFGNLVTLATTSLNNQNGGPAAVLYPSSVTGAVPPTHAWNFTAGKPQIAGYYQVSGYVAAIAYDTAGNAYLTGQLATASSSVSGVFVAPSSARSGGFVSPARTIPSDATTTIGTYPTGLALDQSGTIYVAQGGSIAVFSPGAAGGTTDVRPIRTITSPTLNVTSALLTTTALPIAFANNALYLVNQNTNAAISFPSNAQGSTTPATTISGRATMLNNPIAIAIGPSNASAASAVRRRP